MATGPCRVCRAIASIAGALAADATAATLAVSDPVSGTREFGNVATYAPPAASTVTLGSSGPGVSTVTGFSEAGAGCGEFTETAPVPAMLANGDSLTVTVVYAPVNRGSDSCTVTVQHDGAGAVSFVLTGTGTAAQLQVTTLLLFPNQRVGTQSSLNLTLGNSGNEAITSSNINVFETSTDYSIGIISGLPIDPGGSAILPVTFAPAVTGLRNASLTVQINNRLPSDSDRVVSLSGTGTASAQAFVPVAFDFGAVLVGVATTRSFSIGNTGTATLNLGMLTLTGGNAGEFEFTDHGCSGQACIPPAMPIDLLTSDPWVLRCTPSILGQRATTLVVASDDPGSPRSTTVSCIGVTDDLFADSFE